MAPRKSWLLETFHLILKSQNTSDKELIFMTTKCEHPNHHLKASSQSKFCFSLVSGPKVLKKESKSFKIGL